MNNNNDNIFILLYLNIQYNYYFLNNMIIIKNIFYKTYNDKYHKKY